MTLTTPYQASFYVGDGVTKAFPFVFEEVSDNFVKVIVSHIDGTTSIPTYTVDLDLKQVVFGDETPAPTADDIVCIYRETPTIQDTPFKTLEGYNAKALENILSKIVAMIQEIKSNYFSTQVLQGDPWQLDLLKSADDGATVNIDYVAKKLVKGLYFQISNGNLQVSADGSSYITMPKSADIVEFRQVQTVLEDLTVQYRLQYRIGNEWFNAESNAEATADEAKQIAEEARDIASDAKDIAQDAKDMAQDARDIASDAKDIAEGIDAKAQEALDTVTELEEKIIVKSDTIPTASADLVGSIYQYVGETSQTYEHGYIYECKKGGVFTPGIISCSVNDLKAYIQSETPYYGGVVKLTMTKKTDGLSKLWEMTAKDINNNIVPTYNSLFMIIKTQEDWESVGFTFSNNIAVDTVVSFAFEGPYVWERIDVQPNNDAEVTELQADVAEIQSVIPTQASASNQLADKNYVQSSLDAVSAHITDTNNPHSVTATQVGLGNCDNTADLDKPISTATQTALDFKANSADLAAVATSGDYDDLLNKPTIGNATLTIQKNGTAVDTFTANATADKTINIVVPTQASDVNALPDSTKYTANVSMTINSSTYVITLQLKDQDGNNLGTAQTIDLPLESVVVSGSYDSVTKEVVLTLQGGSTIRFSVADLVSGLQTEITALNMLDADLVDDTTSTHKFVTTTEKSTWNGKQDEISDLVTIRSGASAGATAVQPGDLATVATTGSYTDLLNKPTIPAAQVNSDWNAISGVAQILNKPTLGTAAAADTTDFATATQGGKADTAVQPGDLATVATSGSYTDLSNTPTIPTTLAGLTGDVSISSPSGGEHLVYDAVAGKWKNTPSTAAISWGGVTGTLSDQADLQNALNGKADVATTLSGYGITDGAKTDLSNLTSTGANIGNWSSNVTNCITEIPQDIKLELNNGTLTLKAGSKVYMPNGFESDGTTPKFTIVTVPNDLTADTKSYSGLYAVSVTPGLEVSSLTILLDTVTSSSAPVHPSPLQGWYDTTNNYIKRYSSGWQITPFSLPLCKITSDGTNITSIDQVFNGFGYIGSTVFALPGVKGLIPNGRNADGSLKNTTTNDFNTVKTINVNTSTAKISMWNSGSLGLQTNGFELNEQENFNYDSGVLTKAFEVASVVVGLTVGSYTQIKSFTPKTVFHAVDYSEIATADFVVACQKPTSSNNYTWYRKYKSGWVEQGGYYTDTSARASTVTFPVTMSDTNYTATGMMDIPGDTGSAVYYQLTISSRNTANMTVVHRAGSSGTACNFSWRVEGRAAN